MWTLVVPWLTSTPSYCDQLCAPICAPNGSHGAHVYCAPLYLYSDIYSKDLAALYFKWLMIIYVMIGKISDAPPLCASICAPNGSHGRRMFIAPYFSYLLKIFRIFCKMTFTMLILKLLGSKSIFDIFRTHHNYQHLLDVAPWNKAFVPCFVPKFVPE